MNSLNGGYAMIKHNATQKELADAYKIKKPVLLYDADHRAHWAQINEKEVETIDEETQETIITYEYSYQLLNDIEALVDDSGNPRFIEGDGTPDEIEGFISSYCKWSLSGTHLMLVLAGSIANGTTISTGSMATYDIPVFIMDKIYPVWANRFLEIKTLTLVADDFSNQTLSALLNINNGKLNIYIQNSATLTKNRAFRIQFDLLIDNE